MVKVGIIGVGCVGTAVKDSIQNKIGFVSCYDKYKNIGSLKDVLDTDIIMLCLPTPYCNQQESYDMRPIDSVCKKLAANNYKGLVVVKSTVTPLTCETLASKYNLAVCHNPEFLSAGSAYDDFHYQDHIVIGWTSTAGLDRVKILIDFYKEHYSDNISVLTSHESESMKIFCNTFYAVKIQVFNEMYLLCKKLDIDFENVKNAMFENGWINPMHTKVPGTDGKLSYGGMCFPKDTNALMSFMQKQGTPHRVIEATITEHDLMRPDQHRLNVLHVPQDERTDQRYHHRAA